jgi:hypothetical protein
MNPILVQQMADHRMDALDREADAARLAAVARAGAVAQPAASGKARIGELLRIMRRGAFA